jgi:hypothetical protein
LDENAPRSGFVRTDDGVRLHYLEAGTGPDLLLVPGWSLPAELWRQQIEEFSQSHHLVAVDHHGQGLSDKPTHGYRIARLAHPRHRDSRPLGCQLGRPFHGMRRSLGVLGALRRGSAEPSGPDRSARRCRLASALARWPRRSEPISHRRGQVRRGEHPVEQSADPVRRPAGKSSLVSGEPVPWSTVKSAPSSMSRRTLVPGRPSPLLKPES